MLHRYPGMHQPPLGMVHSFLVLILHLGSWHLGQVAAERQLGTDWLQWAQALHLLRVTSVRVGRIGGQEQGWRVQLTGACSPVRRTDGSLQWECCPVSRHQLFKLLLHCWHSSRAQTSEIVQAVQGWAGLCASICMCIHQSKTTKHCSAHRAGASCFALSLCLTWSDHAA